MTSRGRNVITGVVVLGSLFVFLWMVLKFTGRVAGAFAQKGIPIVVVATRADGVSEGTAVIYRGVTVGKVTSISRTSDNLHVRMSAEVEASPPLPRDLTALIRTQSMLSIGSIIDLQVAGEPTGSVTANQEIPATYIGMQFLPPEFNDILTDVRRQKLIEHTDEVMTNIRDLVGDPKMQTDIRQAIANINTASERANHIAVNFEKFSNDLEKVSNNANDTIAEMRKTVNRAGGDVDDLTRSLMDDTGKMGKVLDQFQQVTAKINNGRGAAGKLLNDPALYDELTDTARELNLVAKSLKRLVDQWEQEGLSLKVK